MKTYWVTLTLTEPLLGTVPLNKELYADYIATKAAELPEDEIESIEEMTEKGTTGFHRVDGKPIIYDYVIKGFLKDACSMLFRVPSSASNKIRAYRKVIDGLVFVKPRQIPIITSETVLQTLERPLRAQTPQGERVALARSEMIPAGAKIEFSIMVMDGIEEKVIREWLDYGALRGLGQWRNGGYGTFTYEIA